MFKKLYLYLLFFILIFVNESIAQPILITDSFSDGNFTSHPQWLGDTAKFKVNNSLQLQLDDNSAISPAYLALNSPIISNASWEFWVRMDFAPSPTNYARVYLSSTEEDMTGNTNGYYVKVGGITGDLDNVSLYRQDGTTSTLIINGLDGTVGLAPAMAKIKVTKNSTAEWELFVDTTLTANNYVSQGKANDDTHLESNYFGIICYYTTTRSDKFLFDNFRLEGEAFQDTIKPELQNITVVDSSALQIEFTKTLDFITALNPNNYRVNKNIGAPAQVEFLPNDSSKVQLSFNKAFQNGEEYFLIVENIKDQKDNQMLKDSLRFLYFIAETPYYRAVVINEFYPDERESKGLPEAEFIELFNASNKFFDLENWKISDASTTQNLPSYLFKPNEYVILCSQKDSADYAQFGSVVPVQSLPTLNNNGDLIRLEDKNSFLLDELIYDKSWYKDEDKSSGGWTIEQINPYTECSGKPNFIASIASIGGTPGTINSQFDTTPDLSPPQLIDFRIISSDSILLTFDKEIDTTFLSTEDFTFSNGNSVQEIYFPFEELYTFINVLKFPIQAGKLIEMGIEGIRDCIGNIMPRTQKKIMLGEQAIGKDIVINEVLFNPFVGGKDFVEIYNRSEKVLDLKDWIIANGVDKIPNIKQTIADTTTLLFPGEYLVLTEDASAVQNFYPRAKTHRFVILNRLPAYNNDKGEIFLFDHQEKLIDYVAYTESMHYELLKNVKGISLERINPHGDSEDINNFHSAAEAEGFATPGYQNSQYSLGTTFKGKVNISPETFSPNNDGYQDWLNINYQFPVGGYVAKIQVYDRQGRLIRQLANNELLGEKGSYKWDGLTDDRQKAPIGIYLVYFEAFNTAGNKEVFKKAAVLVD